MRGWVSVFVAILLFDGAMAAEKLRSFSWSELKAGGQLRSGQVISGEGGEPECLLVENAGIAPLAAEILKLDQPGITTPLYALRGKVRWEGVEGTGYLEMWNHFPGGAAYFSRTPADIGPMAGLRGNGGWREVVLPFSAVGTPHHPSQLVANVVLPGKGKVWVGNLVLFQYREGENPMAASATWWPDRVGGMIGAVGGSLLGTLGGLIGTLCALGRWRSFVLGLMRTITALGLATFLLGLWAIAHEQPYGVYYPLLLMGGLAALLFASLTPVVRRRYAEIELRHMAALNAM